MKKILIPILFIIGVYSASFAQDKKVRIGLRLAPSINMTGVTTDFPSSSNVGTISSGSKPMTLQFGPTFDFFFGENYAFGTGLWYNVKSFSLKGDTGDQIKINAQSISIPLTLKLYTNEIASDLRLYFQLGAVVDVKLAEKYKNQDTKDFASSGKVIKPVNIGPYLGIGAEYVLSSSNSLFAGINYNRGVIQQFNHDYTFSHLKVHSSQLALEIGLKF